MIIFIGVQKTICPGASLILYPSIVIVIEAFLHHNILYKSLRSNNS